MTDPAQHRQRDIESVYGERPRCVFTGVWQFCDNQHILGRNRGDPVYSSIYNHAPLNRDIHKGPHRDHPLIRLFLLDQAQDNVREAIICGEYRENGHDRKFLEVASEYRKSVIDNYYSALHSPNRQ